MTNSKLNLNKKLTPMRAIRANYLDCCCDNTKEVRICSAFNCPLHAYRMGHRPQAGSLPTNTV